MSSKLKRKKVALVTTQFAINYGAVLQAVALNHLLTQSGAEPIVIDYELKDQRYGNKLPTKANSLKSFAQIVLIWLNPVFLVRRHNKILKFKKYLDSNLSLIKVEKAGLNDENFLHKTGVKLALVGSDQVWNPTLFKDPLFTLNYPCFEPIARASYAASIAEKLGVDEVKNLTQNIIKFSEISLRESTYAQALAGERLRGVNVHLDPTLVAGASYWNNQLQQIQNPLSSIEKGYIVVFDVAGPSLLRSAVSIVKDEMKLDVVSINTSPKKRLEADINLFDLGPLEFLKVIKDSSYVVTSSYHALLFSIIFEKPFVLCAGKSRFSRHEEVLNILGLESRASWTEDDVYDCIRSKIDYSKTFKSSSYLSRLKDSENYIRKLASTQD